MDVEARASLEPGFDLGVLMGGVIVDDQMQIEVLGRVAVDCAQETEELLMAMARHAFADDPAGGDVERGEQGRRPVPLVIVGHRAGATLLQRQSRLGAVERLDLALLVDREHQRLVRWVEIKPNDVLNLLTKLRVVGELEAARQMRLEPVRRPDALHARMAQADRLGERARRPERGGRRLLVERHGDTRSIVAASRGGLRPGRVASRSSPATPHAR